MKTLKTCLTCILISLFLCDQTLFALAPGSLMAPLSGFGSYGASRSRFVRSVEDSIQGDAVRAVGQLKSSLSSGDKKGMIVALQTLKQLSVNKVEDPLQVLKRLLDALSGSASEWLDILIKQEIASVMEHYALAVTVKLKESSAGRRVLEDTKRDENELEQY